MNVAERKKISEWYAAKGFPLIPPPDWGAVARDKKIINFYLGQGVSIIPVIKGKKDAAIPWKRYQSERAPMEQVYAWWFRDGHDLAMVCGAISGNVVVEDYDSPKDYRKVRGKGTEKVTLVVKTSRAGRDRKRHVCWRTKSPVPKENLRKYGVDIDLQGEGTYVKIPPSLRDPETGLRYEFDEGRMTPIANWEGEYLHDFCALLRSKLGVKLPKMPARVADIFRPADEGERHDRLLRIVAWLRRCRAERATALEKVRAWNRTCRPPEDEGELEHQFSTMFDRDEPYSFRFDEPPREIYPGSVEDAAIGLLRNQRLLDQFIEESDRMVVMDEIVRKIELLVCVSSYGDLPSNLSLLGPWSTGKTKTITSVTSYFPDVWSLGGLSPKALIHQKGELDVARDAFVIDLARKIILFLEPPQIETLMMLKPLLSRDKWEIEYKYVEKETGRTTTTVLRGWPVCIFCGVTSKYSEEFTSRWMTASPEISGRKIGGVIDRKGEAAQFPNRYAAGDAFRAFRCAFSVLRDGAPYEVVVPYGVKLATSFRKERSVDMRFFDMLLSLIKASTILHAFQREKDSKGRLVAELADYEAAREVFVAFEGPTVYGVGQNVLDFYKRCVTRPGGGNYIYDDLLAKYSEAYGRRISRSQMREEYLKPLERAGLVDFADDPEDRRRKLIVPLPMKEVSLIDDAGFRRAPGNENSIVPELPDIENNSISTKRNFFPFTPPPSTILVSDQAKNREEREAEDVPEDGQIGWLERGRRKKGSGRR